MYRYISVEQNEIYRKFETVEELSKSVTFVTIFTIQANLSHLLQLECAQKINNRNLSLPN